MITMSSEAECEDLREHTPITLAKAVQVIKKLPVIRVLRVDENCPMMVKARNIVQRSLMTCLFSVTERHGALGQHLQRGQLMIEFFKNGFWRVCSSYQGIKHLCLPRKIYLRLLEKRLFLIKPQIQEETCGKCGPTRSLPSQSC